MRLFALLVWTTLSGAAQLLAAPPAWADCGRPAVPAFPSRSFADCELLAAANPDLRPAARCFFEVADKPGEGDRERDHAVRRLSELAARSPRNPWLALYSALLVSDSATKEHLLRIAAGGFVRRDPHGEVTARVNLVKLLLDLGRTEEARLEVKRETAAAFAVPREAPEKESDSVRAALSRARLLLLEGDLEHASLLLDGVPPECRGPSWLAVASNVYIETGQLDRGWQVCEAQRLSPDPSVKAAGWYCRARVLAERTAELPSEANRQRILSAAGETLAAATAGGDERLQALAHRLEAMLSRDGATARQELLLCRDAAPSDAEKGLCDDPVVRAQAQGNQMRLSWRTRSFGDFIDDAQAALQQIELLRANQQGTDFKQDLFSTWSADYYWFSGRLLERTGSSPSYLDLAFEVMEKLRARTLRDILARDAGVAAAPAPARAATLGREIDSLSKRRQDQTLPASERANAASDLGVLLPEYERLLRTASSAPAAGGSPPVAAAAASPARVVPAAARSIASEVQALLAPDEALLSFQVAPWIDWTGDFGGGSWLVVLTRTSRRLYRLGEMGRPELRLAVAEIVDLVDRLRPTTRRMTDLYNQLLGPALADLPPTIDHLIVVPDDHLHRLPFAALRASQDGRPLVWRYEISIVPSATLWAHWRSASRPPAAGRPALVLADPPPPAAGVQRDFQAAGINLPAAALPAARQEAHDLVRNLGWRCESRVGDGVSVAALLDSPYPLSRFALVHLAAHSIVDDRDPRRSGIWLAASPGHDGLLRPADIVNLRFDDRLVVLSTCSGNGGAILHGEGVMSLAHAFFQAHARTVVASLWPLADGDAEALSAAFYRHLRRGVSVAAALREAQLDRLRQSPNLPPATWAGVVVLGDGGLVPFPGGLGPATAWWLPAAAGALLAVAFLVALLDAIRRARRRAASRVAPTPRPGPSWLL